MVIYDLLRLHRDLLQKLVECSVCKIKLDYMDLYEDYLQLSDKQYKKTWIEVELCKKYGITKSTFYRVLKRYGEKI